MRTLLFPLLFLTAAPALADAAVPSSAGAASTDALAPIVTPDAAAAVERALELQLDSELIEQGACQTPRRKRNRNRGRQRSGGGGAQSGGAFGLGLQLGWPTGLAGMFRLGADQGVQFALGFGGGAAFIGSVDYVWEFFQLTSIDPGHLSLYVGGGLFVGAFPFGFGYVNVGTPYAGRQFPLLVGIEVPFGLRWRFHRLPIDIFGEVAPTVSVLPGFGFSFRGALGARFYF